MQIVPNGDNLHEMSELVFCEKLEKIITNLLSAELAQESGKGHCEWILLVNFLPFCTIRDIFCGFLSKKRSTLKWKQMKAFIRANSFLLE